MKRIVLSLSILTTLTFSAVEISACQCIGRPTSELSRAELRELVEKRFKEVSAVFVGDVVAMNVFQIKFKVIEEWKGMEGKEVVLRTDAIYDQGLLVGSHCDSPFEVGSKYLVYARKNGTELQSRHCDGTKKWVEERGETEILRSLRDTERRRRPQ
jgi:hypothetical protein